MTSNISLNEEEKELIRQYNHEKLDDLIDNLIVASGYVQDPDKIVFMDYLVDKLIDMGDEEFAKINFSGNFSAAS